MKHKIKNRLLRSATERRIAVFKALDIELGNSFDKWTNRSRAKRHIVSKLFGYFENEIPYLLDLKVLWEDDKHRLRWTKIGRRIRNEILRLFGVIWQGLKGTKYLNFRHFSASIVRVGDSVPPQLLFFLTIFKK